MHDATAATNVWRLARAASEPCQVARGAGETHVPPRVTPQTPTPTRAARRPLAAWAPVRRRRPSLTRRSRSGQCSTATRQPHDRWARQPPESSRTRAQVPHAPCGDPGAAAARGARSLRAATQTEGCHCAESDRPAHLTGRTPAEKLCGPWCPAATCVGEPTRCILARSSPPRGPMEAAVGRGNPACRPASIRRPASADTPTSGPPWRACRPPPYIPARLRVARH